MKTNDPTLRFLLDDKAAARRDVIENVLSGTPTFFQQVNKLTLKEIYAAYKLEAATHQRSSVLNRLEVRARALASKRVGAFFKQLRKENQDG